MSGINRIEGKKKEENETINGFGFNRATGIKIESDRGASGDRPSYRAFFVFRLQIPGMYFARTSVTTSVKNAPWNLSYWISFPGIRERRQFSRTDLILVHYLGRPLINIHYGGIILK